MNTRILPIILLLSACGTNSNNQNDKTSASKEITGDIAYEITDYVEDYWRIVGNSGFDSSIYKVVSYLKEAGYSNENKDARLNYRIEERKLEKPTWEPVSSSLVINGDTILKSSTNRNMIAINSFSANETAEIVEIKKEDIPSISSMNLNGKIVYTNFSHYPIFKSAVIEGGALGVLSYSNPSYLQPEKNRTSIQFRSIPYAPENKPWGIILSYDANEKIQRALSNGQAMASIDIETLIYPSKELTLVAEIKGSELPDERLVFSAHVQEPGANDNASGVGAATEMAVVLARLINSGEVDNRRTITFLWGDEMVSTRRYVFEDSIRAKNIKWGISLDMVGENTSVTGGTFLIEKMPDPSAIWTRGKDKHSEWGGSPLSEEDMMPHYLNDLVINNFKEVGKKYDWVVKANPFEGGSDHVPFLRGDIPSVLFWHFTDQFYHTDNDRIDKVSKETLRNVATGALNTAIQLASADYSTAKEIISLTTDAAINRLKEEIRVSKDSIAAGQSIELQREILKTWKAWYDSALNTTVDMVSEPTLLKEDISLAKMELRDEYHRLLNELN